MSRDDSSCHAPFLTCSLGDLDKPFLLPVEDVFSISGRGTVATGRVERGVCNKGEEVEILGFGTKLKSVLTGIGKTVSFLSSDTDTQALYRGVPQGVGPR